ncbi:NCS1 family nucleobase:cation symporter-1 [candidate division KSB1 bacterium]|nr:NCS1 family nucleobase:cation symporter-1 [candidate division KSB1 bacterium]
MRKPSNLYELVELSHDLPESRLSNADISPTKISERTWNYWHIAALWVGMSVCVPTYMLAASMISAGMNWWQSLFVIFLGNFIVLIPLVINAHAGTKYGIPFPVYVRSSFGTMGAHIPSILRSLVACGWFGIQTWIGGMAIHAIISILWESWQTLGGSWSFMGYGLPHYTSFMLFWLINMYFVWAGTDSIKWLETLAAPFLLVMGILLLVWAALKVGGIGTILDKSNDLIQSRESLSFWGFIFTLFIPWLTAMVGYWATLSLNIPDFSRYVKSQKDQLLGQTIGILTAMPLYAFIGIAVTSATLILYGEAIWDPVKLLTKLTGEYNSPLLGILAMFALAVATLSTNIAANIVSAANSFSNLNPQKISFRMGGLIAGCMGILIMPWKLLDMYLTWLITYSGLLGAVGGVILCDYVFIRKGNLNLEDLYQEKGEYAYKNGLNRKALIALVAGILVALMGKVFAGLEFLFNGAWFSAAIVSFMVYYFLMRSNIDKVTNDK